MFIVDIFTSFISILEKNIYGIFIKVHNILQKNSCLIKNKYKDKNSNENLSVINKPAVVSPVSSNNDLTIELQDQDLYDCNV
jgi:hypothetical protein